MREFRIRRKPQAASRAGGAEAEETNQERAADELLLNFQFAAALCFVQNALRL